MKELQNKITDLEMELRMSMACSDELRMEVARLQKFADDMNKTANGAFLDGRKNAESKWLSLEKQYAESLGRLAQLCNTVIPWLVEAGDDAIIGRMPPEIRTGIDEIMDYVESVKP